MTTTRLSSWLLLGGILTGFLGATWQAHLAAGYSKPAKFKRFHQRISPDAIYHPPYAMMETLALARWSPGRTLVIIGGNSILNGVGQPASDLWNVHLQDHLGEAYVVVNLALRGAFPTQGAALVAESLHRRGYPVIYVANTNPAAASGRAPGGAAGYLYWQAQPQQQLTPYAPRDENIRRWLDSLPPAERAQQAEERLGGQLETWTRHQSLWHHVGYRHFFTVWNFVIGRDFWWPRHRFPDNEPAAAPLEHRFLSFLEEEMTIVRGFSLHLAVPGPAGGWELESGNRQRMGEDIEAAFVPALRPRMLMLLIQNSAHHRNRLSPEEKSRDDLVYAASAQIWRDHGIACEVVGTDFAPVDFIDRAHLSSDGGRKLARLVADKISQIDQP
jgi:lysophospholipase L1-like esterase